MSEDPEKQKSAARVCLCVCERPEQNLYRLNLF